MNYMKKNRILIYVRCFYDENNRTKMKNLSKKFEYWKVQYSCNCYQKPKKFKFLEGLFEAIQNDQKIFEWGSLKRFS